MTVILAISIPNSNVETILHPVDSLGNVCGITTNKDLPYMAYADTAGNGGCVKECWTGASVTAAGERIKKRLYW